MIFRNTQRNLTKKKKEGKAFDLASSLFHTQASLKSPKTALLMDDRSSLQLILDCGTFVEAFLLYSPSLAGSSHNFSDKQRNWLNI